jgi:nucleoid DNA-binding protein
MMPGKLGLTRLAQDIEYLLDIKTCNSKRGRQILHAILDTIIAALRRGDDVNLPGFGKFKVYTRPPFFKVGTFITRDARTSARIDIPAKQMVMFIPSQSLTATINYHGPKNFKERRILQSWDANDHS